MKLHDPSYLMKYAAFAAGLATAQYDEKNKDGTSTTFSTAMKLSEDPDAFIKQANSLDPDFPEMVHDAASVLQLLPPDTNWYYPGKGSTVSGGFVAALQEQAETCSRMAAAIIAGTPATAAALS